MLAIAIIRLRQLAADDLGDVVDDRGSVEARPYAAPGCQGGFVHIAEERLFHIRPELGQLPVRDSVTVKTRKRCEGSRPRPNVLKACGGRGIKRQRVDSEEGPYPQEGEHFDAPSVEADEFPLERNLPSRRAGWVHSVDRFSEDLGAYLPRTLVRYEPLEDRAHRFDVRFRALARKPLALQDFVSRVIGHPPAWYGLSEFRPYNCGDARKRGICQNKLALREDVAKERVLGALRDRFGSPTRVLYLRKKLAERLGEVSRKANAELEDRRARLARTEERIHGLIKFISEGDHSDYVRTTLKDLEVQAKTEKAAIKALLEHAAAPHQATFRGSRRREGARS